MLLSLLLGLCWRSPQPVTEEACRITPLLRLMNRAWCGRHPNINVLSMLCARPSLRLRTGALVPLMGARALAPLLGAPVPFLIRLMIAFTMSGRWVL